MKESLLKSADNTMMKTYSPYQVVMERGEGVYLYDAEGKEYLDMGSGIGVNSLGHNHPKLTGALQEQVGKLSHVSNLYYNRPQIEAMEILVKNSNFDKVFFCNSGTEANEAAIKLARKYGMARSPDKNKIITMKQGFHGRTYGSLSATAQPEFWQGFGPMLEGFLSVEFNDIEDFKDKFNAQVAAVILEVIQGESGIIMADKEYLKAVRDMTEANDTILIIDEVQTGAGRTGKFFAHEHFDISPDLVTMAKGLGGGLAIGAVLCKDSYDVFRPKDHGTTFGGNPLATKAATVVLEELMEGGLLARVLETGDFLEQQLVKLKEKHPIISDIRGLGLMRSIELKGPAKDIINSCIEEGLLLVGSKDNIIRFLPPLIIGKEEISKGINIIDKVLGASIS
ncbi:MAG: aspartate aminotransferase family protein [Tissierellaceae bacterium]